MMEIKKIKYHWFGTALLMILYMMSACSKSQSYSELLRDEEHAVNWYLANYNVALDLPDDPRNMITCEEAGDNAPFYKLDSDGYVYMQVVRADFEYMVASDDLVYFRFERESILDMFNGVETGSTGNSNYLPNGTASFVYKNNYLSSTTKWGTGVQEPLQYVGYNSEVNIVLKSYYGFLEEQSLCVPYIMNIRYFKPEY